MVRIGVFICHCGLNIARVIEIEELVNYAKSLKDVVFATDLKYACSESGHNQCN